MASQAADPTIGKRTERLNEMAFAFHNPAALPLQGYMPDEVIRVLERTYAALEPGGTCLVVDYMLNDEKTGPLDPAITNLGGVRHGRFIGRVNSGAEFRDYFTRAGFEDIDIWWLMEHQLSVVSGKKPA